MQCACGCAAVVWWAVVVLFLGRCFKKETFILFDCLFLLMQRFEIFEQLLDPNIVSLLKVLFNAHEELYLRELARKAHVPAATALRTLRFLVQQGIVHVVAVKHIKLYSIEKNEKTQVLVRLFRKGVQVLDEFLSLVKGLSGLDAVYVYGEEGDERADVLLIGQGIDEGVLKNAVADVKAKHGFVVSYLVLTLEQYKQMSQMGLWSGQKRVVWDKGG